jgi:uncharacterized protein
VDVERLTERDEAALEELLDEDRLVNLFLRGFLAAQPMDAGTWYGAWAGDRLAGVVLLLPGRLTVPWSPDLTAARHLGYHLRRRHRPTMMVGPRSHVDTLWQAWAPDLATRRFHDQRLYICRRAPPGPRVPGFRKARLADAAVLVTHAARMEFEDLGRDPSLEDPELHARVVRDRIKQGKTLVVERGGRVVFQINVGTITPDGCQVGGTYVPPRFRGQGLSVEGMRATLAHLLERHPAVTLHVNEDNRPAVRCYERVGFIRATPYRLLTVG